MTEKAQLISGNRHSDGRGNILFSNDFDATAIKRVYTIENAEVGTPRGWQGHKIEQRWFAAVSGSFNIEIIEIDDFDKPAIDLPRQLYELSGSALDILHVPGGHITLITALEENSKLLVMADYAVGEIADEYRFPVDYFVR